MSKTAEEILKMDTLGIEVGDKVRFACEKTDGDGWGTGKIMRVTGRCIGIELEHNESYYFPKFHVRRDGIDHWFCGKNIQILEKGKRPRKYNFDYTLFYYPKSDKH